MKRLITEGKGDNREDENVSGSVTSRHHRLNGHQRDINRKWRRHTWILNLSHEDRLRDEAVVEERRVQPSERIPKRVRFQSDDLKWHKYHKWCQNV